MSFDPERWLQVADVCCITIPQVDSEALLRTAVNRAYYAALMSVKRRLERVHPSAVPEFDTHQRVLQALQTGDRPFRQMYMELRTLRDLRSTADYELDLEPLVRSEVVKYVDRSRRLIRNRINALRDEEYRRLRVPRP